MKGKAIHLDPGCVIEYDLEQAGSGELRAYADHGHCAPDLELVVDYHRCGSERFVFAHRDSSGSDGRKPP